MCTHHKQVLLNLQHFTHNDDDTMRTLNALIQSITHQCGECVKENGTMKNFLGTTGPFSTARPPIPPPMVGVPPGW